MTKEDILKEKSICIQGIKLDRNKLCDKKYIVKKACQILNNPSRSWDSQSTEFRILLVRSLENSLGFKIKNTKEFRRKIKEYLGDYDFRKKEINKRIKSIRNKLKMTQKQLADQLGYKSHVTIANIENGSRYPTKRVLQWVEEIGM